MSAAAAEALWSTIHNPTALPTVARVLSAPGGPAAVPEADMDRVATVQFKDGVVGILAVDADDDGVRFAQFAAAGAGFEITRQYLVPTTTIRALYDGGSEQTIVTATGRDEADHEIDRILSLALQADANDVHFLGAPATAEIRIHTGGAYVRLDEISAARYLALAKAMYVRCSEKTRVDDFSIDQPMRGQFTRDLNGRRYAVRLQTQTAHPDTIDMTLRLLPLGEQSRGKDFAQLGFASHHVSGLRRMFDQPRGMVVLCGPTGSGKSTTLKSALEYIGERHAHEVKIQTLEDPVEYEISGSRQASVTKPFENESEDTLWTRALTSLMRMRPDVIMLGEVRNAPTAKTAEQAARTGHKFLTTIHADAVFSVYRRFVEYGVKLDALAEDGFMNGIVRQRLLPILCPRCSIPYANAPAGHIEPRIHQALYKASPSTSAMAAVRVRGDSRGCEICRGRGHVGLTVTAEMLLPDPPINDALAQGNFREAERLWKSGENGHLKNARFHTMREHALSKVFAGLVSPRAVDRQVEVLDPDAIDKLSLDALADCGALV